MSISEQVKELREVAENLYKYTPFSLQPILCKAADTIESLSAKLQAANMERSDRYYNGDILSEILENLDKRIGTQLKIMAGLNDETQRYGYAKELDAYQQIKTYVEITLEEYKEKRVAADYGGGWIYCGDGRNLPEEYDSIFARFKGTDKWSNAMFEKTSNEVNVTIEFEDGKRTVKTLHTIDGRWNEGNRGLKFKIIAWQPLPEQYHEH